MTSRAAGSALFITAASGGGGVTNGIQLSRPTVSTGDPDTFSTAGTPVVLADSFWLDYSLPVDDVKFVDFGGGTELLVDLDTGGWWRLRRTVGYSPLSDPKLIEDCVDGPPLDSCAMPDCSASPTGKRLYVAHGRKLSSVRISDGNRINAEDRENFAVTGRFTRETPVAICIDATNEFRYVVTSEGGVYCDDIATQSAPVEEATPLSLFAHADYRSGELLVDVGVWETGGEYVVVVLSTHRVWCLTKSGATLTVAGYSEIVTPAGLKDTDPDQTSAGTSITPFLVSILDRLTVYKDNDGKVIAAVEAQCRGFEGVPQSRPFARIIVFCDLDLAGGYVAPSFLVAGAPYSRYYSPYPTKPHGGTFAGSAWETYLTANPDAAKEDFTVRKAVYVADGTTDYLYVAHGKMRQVRRLTVNDVFTSGVTVGAIIPCHPDYTTDPATNAARPISQVAVDPGDFERFIVFEDSQASATAINDGSRMIVLDAGLETVASNNLLVDTRFAQGAQHDVSVIIMATTAFSVWSLDYRSVAYGLRVLDGIGATPAVIHEKYWSWASDGIAAIPGTADAIYALTFGGVVPYLRASDAAQFFPDSLGYQPQRVDEAGDWFEQNTEQIDVGLAVDGTATDNRVFVVAGNGGFFEYKITSATKRLQAARFFEWPTRSGTHADFPDWLAAHSTYANDIVYVVVDSTPVVLVDITCMDLQRQALLAYVYNSGGDTWDYTACIIIDNGHPAGLQHLTSNVHVTRDLPSRQFAFVCYRSGFFVVRIDQLISSGDMTLVENHDFEGTYIRPTGSATSLGKLFLTIHGPELNAARGQLHVYDFNTLTGVVDMTPVQVIDSTSLNLPTNHAWKESFNVRFLQLDAGTGAGGVYICTGLGTLIELEYDPAAGGTSRATFYANIEPNGFEAEVYWRYRDASTSVWIVTGKSTVPGSSLSSVVSLTVVGLAPATDYEVQAFGEATDGPFTADTVAGEIVQFTTPAAGTSLPPIAQTASPTDIGETTATLNARVNPNGVQTLVRFEYIGPSGAITAEQDIGSGFAFVAVSQAVTGLIGETDYAFRVTAANAEGQTTIGNLIAFTTAGETGSAPSVSGLTVSSITPTSALATVAFDTGGLPCTVIVQYGTTSAYGSSEQVQVAFDETTRAIALSGLAAGTLHHAQATIANQIAATAGEDVTFTTLGAGNAPTGTTTLPSGIGGNFATLHAMFDPNGETTSVLFQLQDETSPSPLPVEIAAGATSASATAVEFSARAPNLQPFHTYSVRAIATNASGTAAGRIVKFKTAGGDAGDVLVATSVAATDISSNAARLKATLQMDNRSTSWYFEYWITGQDKKFTLPRLFDIDLFGSAAISEPVAELVSGLADAQAYNYRIAGVNSNSPDVVYGSTLTFTTGTDPVIPPATGLITFAGPLTSTSIAVRGRVHTNGEDTELVFQASTTSAFTTIASESAMELVADPSDPLAIFAATLTGLSAATDYYLRMELTHLDGPVISHSPTFGPVRTNNLVLPTVVTNPLSGATPTTLQASGTITVPADTGAGPVFAWVEWGRVSQPNAVGYEHIGAEVNIGAVAGVFNLVLQLGGPQAPPPLEPDTRYFARWKARNGAGQTNGIEVNLFTTAGGGTNDPAVSSSAPTFNLPNSFNMHGLLNTNGSDTTVVFQWVDATLLHQFDSGDMVESAPILVPNHPDAQPIGVNTGYHAAISHKWQYRIKATNASGIDIYSAQMPVVAVLPTAFSVEAIQNIGTRVTATHVGFQDSTNAHISMWFKHAPFGRIWMQMIWGTDPTLATFTAGRMVSHNATPEAPPVAPEYLEVHYADDLTGLTPATTYYYRLRCWSAGGDHLGDIASFTTDAASKWSASWAASVGTKKPAYNVMGFVPKNLRTGAGTIGRRSVAGDITNDCDMGFLTYASANGEDAHSIFVSPTAVTFGSGHPNALSGSLTQLDTVQGCNLAHAIEHSLVGDKIWVDGSARGMMYRFDTGALVGAISVGNTVRNAASTWTAMVTYLKNVAGNRAIGLRLLSGTLPSSGVPGSAVGDIVLVSSPVNLITGALKVYEGAYAYQGPDIGGDGGATSEAPTDQEGFWRIASLYYPVTGLRILSRDPTQRALIRPMGLHRDHGGVNGVFFKNLDFTRGISDDNYCVGGAGLGGAGGGGVVGFYDCTFKGYDIDRSLGNRGLKTSVKGDAPHTWDFRGCDGGPAQEHGLVYGESWGCINPQAMFFADCTTTGTNWDGTIDFNGRTFMQLTSRGDHWQNKGTGSGYPPGRGTIWIDRCDAKTDSTDGGQGFSFWGFHGVIHVTDCRYLGSNSLGSIDSGGFLTQMDTGKGGWFNANGFAVNEVVLTRWTNNVNNAADPQIQLNSTEKVTINDFFLTMNNKVAFSFLGANSTFDNGFVKFVLTLGTAVLTTYVDTATPRTFGWDVTVPWSQRIHHKGVSVSRGTLTPTDPDAVNALQNGVRYWALY